MTVQTETSRSGPYAGAGTTGPFAVGFRFLDNTHLQVIRTSTAGIDSTLVITTDYSVSGAGGSSGTVTLVSALAVGEKLTIIRDVPFTQLADYVDNDAFPAESHESALDKLTMQTQQNREVLDRSLTLPATVSGVSTELPPPQASQLIGWNIAANALRNFDSSSLGVTIAYAAWVPKKFSGNGATTTFVLDTDAGSAANCDVTVGGVTQIEGVNFTYTSATKTITFLTGAPPVGVNNVYVRYGQALPLGSVVSSNITDATAIGLAVLTAASQAVARTALGAAASGALASSGITGAAASGANADITSLGGLTSAVVPVRQVQPISASVAANALTISASALALEFRSTTLGSGAVTLVQGTPANLVISSGSTLGTINAQQSRIVVLAINNAGTIELAAVNISGGTNLDETGLITTVAEGGAGAADSATVVYSTTARTSVAYRVIGYIESTQATAGTWATAPSTIQGQGGQALSAMSSLGFGQTWIANGSGITRVSGTTYYNTTGKPITVVCGQSGSGVGQTLTVVVNGTAWPGQGTLSGGTIVLTFVVSPGQSYSVTCGAFTIWQELR